MSAVIQAAEQGADWIIAPETALQGYFWAVDSSIDELDEQSPDFLKAFQQVCKDKGVTLFLGTAELEPCTWHRYNSSIVIGSDGEFIGSHRKLRGHGRAEAWAMRSEVLKPVPTSPLVIGVLICSDSWHPQFAQAMKDQGADVLLVPAAWPPGECGPGDCWEQRSLETGLPVWVCNQTGKHPRLDFGKATSVVVQGGETLLSYHGEQETILLFQWDEHSNRLLNSGWKIIPFGDDPAQEHLRTAS